jgi:hypothetical protein
MAGRERRGRSWGVRERAGACRLATDSVQGNRCGERLSVPQVDIRPVELAGIFSSSLAPLVTTLKSTNTRERDDFGRGGGRWRDGPNIWSVLGQPQVAAILVI